MSWIGRMTISAAVLLCSSTVVLAQTDSRLAVGASVSKDGGSIPLPGASKLAVLWRLGSGDEGWGFRYGLNWYSSEVDDSLGGDTLPFGKLRVRPFMAGYGYAHRFGRVRVSANLLGGVALNSFSMRPGYEAAFTRTLGAEHVTADVSNSLVLRPELSSWIDLNGRIGLNITAGYMLTRPTVTMKSSRGQERRTLRGDMLTIKVGAVYSIF
jgi:hypothetical protein